MKNGLLGAVVLALAVVGCGPIYDTTYEMIPPSDGHGRMCTAQCQQTQSFCRANCQQLHQECVSEERHRGMHEYDQYVRERRREGLQIKRSPDSFINTYRCDTSCESGCEGDYRQCFATCGGKVIPHRVCTAFCDQIPAAPVAKPAAQSSAPSGKQTSNALCVKGAKVQAYSEDEWYDAVVKANPLPDGRCPVHYEGYGDDDDEKVLPSMLRRRS